MEDMNFYRVKVGRNTRKGMETIHEFVVGTKEDNAQVVHNAMLKKYEGFAVTVESVKNVTFLHKGENKPPEVSYFEEKFDSMETPYYRGFISKHDIPEWAELMKPVSEATEALKKAEDEFRTRVLGLFDLKGTRAFKRTYNGISVAFEPSQFKFNRVDKDAE